VKYVYEWQLEQLPPEQEAQLEPAAELVSRGLLDCTANALKSLVTSPLWHEGHSTDSFCDLSSTSKSERHLVHVYSKMGMDSSLCQRLH
jgi:hypothetical protein